MTQRQAPPTIQYRTASSITDHVRETVRLAVPVTLGRIGILVLVAVDTAMLGRVDSLELAYYSLAIAPLIPMLLVGLGLLMGTVVLTAQAVGAGEPHECGSVWRVAIVHAAAIGFVAAALCYAGEGFLRLTGQSPALAEGAGHVLVVLGWGLPGALLYAVCTFFLEGINRPVPGMVVMLGANVLNFGLNWVLIYGHLGVPPLGAEGAALATSIVRWSTFVALGIYVLTRVDRSRFGIGQRSGSARTLGRRLRRIGYPLSLAHGLESAAFSTMTLFAGLLGPTQVSAYQIAINLVALVFMGAIGIGTAGSVRVGNAVGRRDVRGVRVAGWVSVALAVLLMSVCAVVFYAVPESLAAIYAADPAVVAVAAATIAVAAFALVADGLHATILGALRGMADVWPATGLYLLSFWGVMVPLGYVSGVVHAGGSPALMGAVLVGAVVASGLLALRFHLVSTRDVARA